MTIWQLAVVNATILFIFWLYVEERLSNMASQLDPVKANITALSASVDTLLADYATAKGNAVDPAEVTAVNAQLTDIQNKITAAITPPAA